MISVWVGPALQRAGWVPDKSPVTYSVSLRLDGIYGVTLAQVFGQSVGEVTRRARLVRLALEQKEATT